MNTTTNWQRYGIGKQGCIDDGRFQEAMRGNSSPRMFSVLIIYDGNRAPSAYPLMTGRKALELMRNLLSRGFDTIAETTANGITETLTLSEMNVAVL